MNTDTGLAPVNTGTNIRKAAAEGGQDCHVMVQHMRAGKGVLWKREAETGCRGLAGVGGG